MTEDQANQIILLLSDIKLSTEYLITGMQSFMNGVALIGAVIMLIAISVAFLLGKSVVE